MRRESIGAPYIYIYIFFKYLRTYVFVTNLKTFIVGHSKVNCSTFVDGTMNVKKYVDVGIIFETIRFWCRMKFH